MYPEMDRYECWPLYVMVILFLLPAVLTLHIRHPLLRFSLCYGCHLKQWHRWLGIRAQHAGNDGHYLVFSVDSLSLYLDGRLSKSP